MNVGRKLLVNIREIFNNAGPDLNCLDIALFEETLEIFEKWIEFHEEMFDHSKFKKGVSKKRIKEWEEYYENISNR